jgi:hypothetical protein
MGFADPGELAEERWEGRRSAVGEKAISALVPNSSIRHLTTKCLGPGYCVFSMILKY